MKPRWLVLSPHCDDAALSVGGVLYKRRRRVDVAILTLVTRSDYAISSALAGDVEKAWDAVAELSREAYSLAGRSTDFVPRSQWPAHLYRPGEPRADSNGL
jgi:hypothetical protein